MNILDFTTIIFDVDGTLVDSVDLHAAAWQQALRDFRQDFPFMQVRHLIGKGGTELMETLLTPEQIADFGDELKAYRTDLFREHYIEYVKPFPDVPELMYFLKNAGELIAVGSSAAKAELNYYLDLLKIASYIDLSTSDDDVAKAKPHPDIFETIKQRANLDAAECVVIGDSPYDAQAAQKAGITSMGFLCGGFEESDLVHSGVSALCRNPTDLLQRLRTRKEFGTKAA